MKLGKDGPSVGSYDFHCSSLDDLRHIVCFSSLHGSHLEQGRCDICGRWTFEVSENLQMSSERRK